MLVHIATGYNYCVDTAAPVHLPMPRKLFCYLFGISPAGIIVPIIDQTFSHGADQPGLWMSG
ncbi:MAG TPA: hypothetical protein VHB01_03065 [Nitrosospira sp.]|nr:hypothetical protein [Nitrosospira sp.]